MVLSQVALQTKEKTYKYKPDLLCPKKISIFDLLSGKVKPIDMSELDECTCYKDLGKCPDRPPCPHAITTTQVN